MADIALEWDDDNFVLAMQQAPVKLTRRIRIRLGVGNSGYLGKWLRNTYIRSAFKSYAPGQKRADQLNSRSGALRRSFRLLRRGSTIDNLEFILGSFGSKYAVTQEYGATIKPRKAKWLTIPVGKALTPTGAPRFGARQAFDKGAFFQKFNSQQARIAQRKGRKIETLFLLRKKVKVPPRMGLRDDFQKQIPRMLQEIALAAREALETK